MRSIITKMKNSPDRWNSRFELAEEEISKLEDKSIEILCNLKNREKKEERKVNMALQKQGHY